MLKSQTLKDKKEFLIRELTRYGGINYPTAYNLLDFFKESYCNAR